MTTEGEKRLFVSGGTGPTASRGVRRLLSEGYALRCLVRTRERERLLPKHSNLEIVYGDLTKPEGWSEAVRGAEAFVNFAHIGFAESLVAACERAGVRRLISLSSTRRFTRFPESTARMVIAGEGRIEASGLDYTILRPAMIYGTPRDNNVEKIVRWAGKHRWMPLVRGGGNLIQPIHSDDVVDAVVRALTRPAETRRRAMTLAGPESISWREMIETIAREMNRRLIFIPIPFAAALGGAALLELAPGRPIATRDQVRRLLEDKAFDITEARAALGGWSPRSFADGVRQKLAEARESGKT